MRFTADQISKLHPDLQKQVLAQIYRVSAARGTDTPFSAEMPLKRKETAKKGRVPKVRNGGTWTEAKYWGHLRSALRRAFRFWKPAIDALNAARIPCTTRPNQKWAYRCFDCGKYFIRKEVQIDHVIPCGTLLGPEDVARFLQRLTTEDPNGFTVRCKKCHQAKTTAERSG